MSTCISQHGEYSEHDPGDWCPLCGAFNEKAIVAERDALRAKLDKVRGLLPHTAPIRMAGPDLYDGREGSPEHRTCGGRAWCYDCSQWCYAKYGCPCCDPPVDAQSLRDVLDHDPEVIFR